MTRITSIAAAGLVLIMAAGSAQSAPKCAAETAAATFQAATTFDEVRRTLSGNYAYWNRIDADAAFDAAAPVLLSAPDQFAFADRLETLLLLFRDSHLHVSPTSDPVTAWVPSGADLWFTLRDGRLVVQDVKNPSAAHQAGIRPGWELVEIEGEAPRTTVRKRFSALGLTSDAEQEVYAVNALASGKLGQERRMVFRVKGKAIPLTLPAGYGSIQRPDELLTVTRLEAVGQPPVAVIRINNSLGKNELIGAFDAAVAELPAGVRVVIDLRDTPSGGNTTVARAIMGHFISEPKPYQRHEMTWERVTFGVPRTSVEYVTPRAPLLAPPVVLAGLWTGSMGEGTVIGLDAAADAHLVGSPMGDLLGSLISDRLLTTTCLSISYANEKLWHVDGRPREDFVPEDGVAAADTAVDGSDEALARAVAWARLGG